MADDGEEESDAHAPGKRAIDRLLAARYPGQAPHEVIATASRLIGGEYPIDQIRIYASDAGGQPHWHYIAYGLSALYDNQIDDHAVAAGPAVARGRSGRGFELTLRLPRGGHGEPPPRWGSAILLELSRYVAESGRTLAAGDHLAPQWRSAPGEPPTEIRAFVLALDPELGSLVGPLGRVDFLQVVGITSDESALLGEPGASELLLGELGTQSPRLVTDPGRASLLADPDRARALAQLTGGVLPVGALLDEHLAWRRTGAGARRAVEIRLSAQVVPALLRTARAALPRGQQVMLVGGRGALVVLRAGAEAAVRAEPDGLVIALPVEELDALAAALLPERGHYTVGALPGLAFEVVPFMFRDADGTVMRTVG